MTPCPPAATAIVRNAQLASMDSTKDSPRPGSRSARERTDARGPSTSATGMNAGPREKALPNEDAAMGSTSAIEPELRGKPKKGSRLDADL